MLPALYLRYATPAEPGLAPEDELMHRWAGVKPETVAAPAGANGDPLPAKQEASADHRSGEGDGVLTRRSARMLTAGLVVAAAVSVSACKEVETETATGYEPAKLTEVKGNEDIKRVTFTEEGAERTGVETEKVRRQGGRTVVPYAA